MRGRPDLGSQHTDLPLVRTNSAALHTGLALVSLIDLFALGGHVNRFP
jgi:hypothetical protein